MAPCMMLVAIVTCKVIDRKADTVFGTEYSASCVAVQSLTPFRLNPQSTPQNSKQIIRPHTHTSLHRHPITSSFPSFQTMRPGKVETFTPGPNGYSVYELKVDRDELVKEIQDAGLFHRPTCYSIAKDLGIFARPKSSFPSIGEEVFIQWKIEVSDFVASASSACQFCPLIACRLFSDPGFMFVFSNGSGKTTIGCCGEAKVEDRDESCAEKVENLRKFVEENPDANVTVMVQPVNEEWGVGKVRFTVAFSNRGKEVGELIGVRSELLVKFYAAEGDLVQLLTRRAN